MGADNRRPLARNVSPGVSGALTPVVASTRASTWGRSTQFDLATATCSSLESMPTADPWGPTASPIAHNMRPEPQPTSRMRSQGRRPTPPGPSYGERSCREKRPTAAGLRLFCRRSPGLKPGDDEPPRDRDWRIPSGDRAGLRRHRAAWMPTRCPGATWPRARVWQSTAPIGCSGGAILAAPKSG